MERVKIGMISEECYPPTAMQRIYVKRLADRGYLLDRIILVRFDRPSAPASSNRRFLPYGSFVRRLWGEKAAYNLRAIYRTCLRKNTHDRLYRQVIESCEPLDAVFFRNFSMSDYCDKITHLRICDFDDPAFCGLLEDSGLRHFIYASSALLTRRPLDLGIDYILAHPGVLPDIRGVDCFLWSLLYRGRIGYSVIRIDKGVDTGDVILSREMDAPQFHSPIAFTAEDYVRFRRFLGIYNAQKKAEILAEAVGMIVDSGYGQLGKRQLGMGRQFYRAHRELVEYVMRKIVAGPLPGLRENTESRG